MRPYLRPQMVILFIGLMITPWYAAGLNSDREERSDHTIKFLKETIGIKGGDSSLTRLNEDQMKQLIEWLNRSEDPYNEFNKLGTERERFYSLHRMFLLLGDLAAQPYLARSFLDLCCSDEIWPPAEATFSSIAHLYRRTEKVDELINIINKCAEENSTNARLLACCAFAEAYAERHWQPLFSLFDQAIKAAGTSEDKAQIIAWKARAMRLRGGNSEAIPLYEQALALNPIKESSWDYMEVLGEQNQKEKLDAFLPKALGWFPQETYATYKSAGIAYMRARSFDLAEKYLKLSLAALPPERENWNISVRYPLAELYARQGMIDKAKTTAREALQYAIQLNYNPKLYESVRQRLQEYVDVSNLTYDEIKSGISPETPTTPAALACTPSSPVLVRVYPAKWISESITQAPEGWEVVSVLREGGKESFYLVDKNPILTDQNIVLAERAQRWRYVWIKLDEQGRKALSKYTADPSHHGEPMAIKVGDRWTAFPVLSAHMLGDDFLIGKLEEHEVQQVLQSYGVNDSALTEDDVTSPTIIRKITGKLISDEEAQKLKDALASRIYLPGREIKSVRCEFVPTFVEINMHIVLGIPGSENYKTVLFEGVGGSVPILYYLGDLITPLLHDEGLLRASKAAFFWQKPEENSRSQRYPATVLLYDDKNQLLNVHPFIGPFLGEICLRLQQLGIQDPFDAHNFFPYIRFSPQSDCKKSWSLGAPRSDENVLYEICELADEAAKKDYSTKVTEIRFTPDGRIPLSVGLKLWPARSNWWHAYPELCRFTDLPGLGKVAITQSGLPSYGIQYTWTKCDDYWLVNHVKGAHIDLEAPRNYDKEKPGKAQKSEWEIAFEKFEINPEIPKDVLEWPAARPVKMDFSTPDAAVETILECLRTGRKDLLPYCTANPPEAPIPKKAPVSHLAYLFDTFERYHEQLKVIERRQEDENWIYTVRIPLWFKEDAQRKFDIKIVPVNGLWKMDGNPNALVFQFYD